MLKCSERESMQLSARLTIGLMKSWSPFRRLFYCSWLSWQCWPMTFPYSFNWLYPVLCPVLLFLSLNLLLSLYGWGWWDPQTTSGAGWGILLFALYWCFIHLFLCSRQLPMCRAQRTPQAMWVRAAAGHITTVVCTIHISILMLNSKVGKEQCLCPE